MRLTPILAALSLCLLGAGPAPTRPLGAKAKVVRHPRLHPAGHGAKHRARHPARPRPAIRGVVPCGGPPPAAGKPPFAPGEILHYDLDVVGIRAGTLDLAVARDGDDYAFTATAQSNTFFDNIRKVHGVATSYANAHTLEPTRYREDATEDGVKKWASVRFDPAHHDAHIQYAIGAHRRAVTYPLRYGPFDVLSVFYYVRTLPMKVGEKLCIDLYGNRKVWRLRGHVDGEEWIDTPAGKFKTWRLAGMAWRLDLPKYHRPIDLWISEDKRRLPVAAVGEIDLGPVRAELTRIGAGSAETKAPDYGGGTW